MAVYFQHGRLPPIGQTLNSSHLGFRQTFIPISTGLPTIPSTLWAINNTVNHILIDLDIDGIAP